MQKNLDEFFGIWNHPEWPESLKLKLASRLTAAMDCAFDRVPKVYLDFETFYDPANGYSLSKKDMTYEAYVRDPRFQVILCSFYIPETGEKYWVSNHKDGVRKELEALRLHECNVIAHNNPFDTFILADYYGIEPMEISCTMTMSRPLHGIKAANDLGRLAERYHLPAKLDEVHHVAGLRLEQFGNAALKRYGDYGLRDTELLAPLYGLFRMHYSEQDMITMSDTIRAGCVCQIQVDVPLLEAYLPRIEQEQLEKVRRIGAMLTEECGHMPDFPNVSTDEAMKKALSSSGQFGQILEALGYEIPMKESKTAKAADGSPKLIPALAKNDMGFKELLRSEDEVLVALCEARLGEKSTINRTRAQSFINIGHRGRMPFPLKAFGAGTGRWSGYQGINMQNLGKRGNDKTLRRSLKAPKGFAFVTCDLSQIEARRMADHANQMDLLKAFEHNEDPYSQFATILYGYEVTKHNGKKTERNVGKECIAEGSLVLTDAGLIPIEKVTLDHLVWDGVNFVDHDGVIDQGERWVMTYDGLTATPDHEVFCMDGTIRTLMDACAFGIPLVRTLDERGPCWFDDTNVKPQRHRHTLSIVPVSQRYDRGQDAILEYLDWRAEQPRTEQVFTAYSKEEKHIQVRRKRVFDIVNAGPAKRYTVSGRLVLNCILSLQYTSWYESFWLRLRTAYDMNVSKAFCKDAVLLYRDTYKNIVNYWDECQNALDVMLHGGHYEFGYERNYVAEKGKIILPDGWVMKYEDLRVEGHDDNGRPVVMYTDRENRKRRKIYRGIIANNTTQGSSARILMAQMRNLREDGIIWAGTVHDELIFLVPVNELEEWCAHIENGMRFRPSWAHRTPIDCELTVGENYADQYDLDVWLAGGQSTTGAEAELLRRRQAASAV